MSRMLDCMVSYFGLDEDERAGLRRYYCYHILAGPGPEPEEGVASITTLAIHDETERCSYCQNFHKVDTGGPAAALAAAIDYLDAFHEQDHLRKVQSDLRGLEDGLSSERTLPAARSSMSQSQGVAVGKG
jgi:hypothetical protein